MVEEEDQDLCQHRLQSLEVFPHSASEIYEIINSKLLIWLELLVCIIMLRVDYYLIIIDQHCMSRIFSYLYSVQTL